MERPSCKIKKFLIFQQMELSDSNIRKFFTFSQKKAFLIFQVMEPPQKLLIFQETYI